VAVAVEQPVAAYVADPVPRGVAQDRCRGSDGEDQTDRKFVGGPRVGRCSDEGRLAGERYAEALDRHEHEDRSVAVDVDEVCDVHRSGTGIVGSLGTTTGVYGPGTAQE